MISKESLQKSASALESIINIGDNAKQFAKIGLRLIEKDPLVIDEPILIDYLKSVGNDSFYAFVKKTYHDMIGYAPKIVSKDVIKEDFTEQR